ncbi:hypothetical protein AURDEDRAFT_126091 [Auricularia subglabra TFB-10046 SS5]|nr:hypothetical protein AURDEDRAFT_126091 [Auricularia subglabra TFB-10046 SS5]
MPSIIGNADAKLEIGGVTARKLSNYLTSYDTLFLIDDSANMRGAGWESVKVALTGLAHEASKFDSDGVSLRFFNSLHKVDNAKSLADVQNALKKVSPRGDAPVGLKLQTIMTELLIKLLNALRKSVDALYAVKPLNVIVLTDGEFSESAEEIINRIQPVIQQIKRIKTPPNFQRYVGIEFVQVGGSKDASDTLQELDDARAEDEDIIDTTRWSNGLSTLNLFKILLGAINKDVDLEEADYMQAPEPETQPEPQPRAFPVPVPAPVRAVYPGVLRLNQLAGRTNEKAFHIPVGFKALVSAKSNASLLQRVQLSLRAWSSDGYTLADGPPAQTYFLEGSGEGTDMRDAHAPGKASRVLTFHMPGWLVIKTLHARAIGGDTQFFDSPNKLLSEADYGSRSQPSERRVTWCVGASTGDDAGLWAYQVGAEDGAGFDVKPDLDFDDTLIKIVVEVA